VKISVEVNDAAEIPVCEGGTRNDTPRTFSVNIYIIDGLTVFPREAYVAVNADRDFYAWIVQDSSAVDVTDDSTFSASRGSFTGNTYTAPSAPSASEGADWVKATYDEETTDAAHDSDVTVVGATIRALDRVPPTQDRDVQVTVTPSLAGSGHTIELDCIRTAGTSGSASVSPSSITTTTTVTVTGGDQTSVCDANNMALRARLDGSDECADRETFTVCAHPRNYNLTGGSGGQNYGIQVTHTWESDSENVAHLDSCWMQEQLFNFHKDTPPFYPASSNPSPSAPFRPDTGTSTDTHCYPASNVYNYCAGNRTYDQNRRFRCERCHSDWATVPNSGYDIEYEVYDNDPSEATNWMIDTTKSGTTGSGSYSASEDIPD
jgi:hypothetical protein